MSKERPYLPLPQFFVCLFVLGFFFFVVVVVVFKGCTCGVWKFPG